MRRVWWIALAACAVAGALTILQKDLPTTEGRILGVWFTLRDSTMEDATLVHLPAEDDRVVTRRLSLQVFEGGGLQRLYSSIGLWPGAMEVERLTIGSAETSTVLRLDTHEDARLAGLVGQGLANATIATNGREGGAFAPMMEVGAVWYEVKGGETLRVAFQKEGCRPLGGRVFQSYGGEVGRLWQNGLSARLQDWEAEGLSIGIWYELSDARLSSGMALEAAITFLFDDDALTGHDRLKLECMALVLNDRPGLGLVVEGHTDGVGGVVYNRALGCRRAEAVRSFLAKRVVDSLRLSAVSYGMSDPVDRNSSDFGRARNRRVEFQVVGEMGERRADETNRNPREVGPEICGAEAIQW